MASNATDLDLLKRLKVPTFDGTGGVGYVTSWADLFRGLTMSDQQFADFVTILYSSLEDVPAEDIERTQKVLDETINEINAHRSLSHKYRAVGVPPAFTNRGADRTQEAALRIEKVVSEAQTIIGPVPIPKNMPVVAVDITETYQIIPARTLMSVTDPVVKGNKSDVVLSITLEVPQSCMNDKVFDDGSVEYGLLGLLATLRVTPICEIVSPAIIPVFVNTIITPDIFEKLREQIAENTTQTREEVYKKVEATVLSGMSDPSYSNKFEAFKKMVGSLNPMLDYIVDRARPSPAAQVSEDKLQGPQPVFAQRLEKGTATVLSVACAFRGFSIMTSGDKTNAFMVKLDFTKYNDNAWHPGKMTYRDANGDPTTDPMACPWIYALAKATLMDPAGRDAGWHYMQPYARVDETASPIEFYWDDPMVREDESKREPGNQNYLTSPTHFLIQSVRATAEMKSAALPLMGSPYPVMQYMGETNMEVVISACITDAVELARLHEMKAELDKINFSMAAPECRKNSVHVRNGLINFLGAYDFVISFINTSYDNEQEKWNVTIGLVESRLKFSDVENLVLASAETKQSKDVRLLWSHIYKLLSSKVRLNKADFSESFENFRVMPFDPVAGQVGGLTDEGQTAWRLIFGNGERYSSILQPNIVAATWYYMVASHVTRAVQDPISHMNRVAWNTGSDPLIKAMMTSSVVSRGQMNEGIGEYFAEQRAFSDTTPAGPTAPGIILDFSEYGRQPWEGDEDRDFIPPVKGEAPRHFIQRRALRMVVKDYVSSFASMATGRLVILNQGSQFIHWLGYGDVRRSAFFSETFWNTYIDLLLNDWIRPDQDTEDPAWTQADIDAAKTALYSLVNTGVYELFPSIAKKMTSLDGERTLTSIPMDQTKVDIYQPGVANYADLRLPTYQKIFGAKEGWTLDESGLKDHWVPLWTKFAPTYGDLGKKPPFTKLSAYENVADALDQTARNPNDPVEPTLPFYHFRQKTRAIRDLEKRREETYRALQEIQTHTIIVPSNIASQDPERRPGGAVSGFLMDLYKNPDRRVDDASFNRQRDHDQLRVLAGQEDDAAMKRLGYKERPKVIYLVSQEGQLLGTVTRGAMGAEPFQYNKADIGTQYKIFNGLGLDVFKPYDQEHMNSVFTDLMQRYPDNGGSMSRIYPAYRLFFIEQDRGNMYLADDLYGTNAVVSFSLRQEKYAPDVLTVTIANATDTMVFEEVISPLQRAEHLSVDAQNKLGLAADDEGEPYFSRLKLRPGVNVQLRLGYGNHYADLPIVFTGAITEVVPGKIIQIVCQGHKRELMNEVQMSYQGLNHFDIVRKILERSPHPNLGGFVRPKQFPTAFARQLFPQYVDDYQLVSAYDRFMNRLQTAGMRNVYLASNAPLEASRRVTLSRQGSSVSNSFSVDTPGAIGSWYDEVARGGFWGGALKAGGAVSLIGGVLGGIIGTFFGPGAGTLAGFLAGEKLGFMIGAVVGLGISLVANAHRLWHLYFSSRVDYLSGKWSTWVVPPQPAWDAILEVTRHRPGHIAQVVPFDGVGTLFVGLPDQPYLAETPPVRESVEYIKRAPAIQRQAQIAIHQEILKPFLDSPWYEIYRAHLKSSNDKNLEMYLNDLGLSKIRSGRFTARYLNSIAFAKTPLSLADLPDAGKAEQFNEFLRGKDRDVMVDTVGVATGFSTYEPPDFKIDTDWYMFDRDITPEWDHLKTIHPEMQAQLFYWYFNIDPQRGRLSIQPHLDDIRGIFARVYTTSNYTFSTDEHVQHLFPFTVVRLQHDTNSPLSMPYSRLVAGADPTTGSIVTPTVENGFLKVSDDDPDFLGRLKVAGMRNEKEWTNAWVGGSDKTLAQVIVDLGGGFRAFIYYLVQYLKRGDFNQKYNRAKVDKAIEKMKLFDLPPGYSTFAGFRVLGPREIISNKIFASMNEMSNCVLVRAPHREVEYTVKPGADQFGKENEDGNVAVQLESTDWRSYPTTDGMPFRDAIAISQRKLGVVSELNAIGPDQKYNVTVTNMAEMLRPMYRGSLLVVGTNLKPYDVVYLQDVENDLRGCIEVASVTHHFSENGWVTEIEPHALVRAHNPTSEAQVGAFLAYAKDLYGWDDLIVDVSNAGFIIALVTAGLGLRIPMPGGKPATTLGGAVGRSAMNIGKGVGRSVAAKLDTALLTFFNNNGRRIWGIITASRVRGVVGSAIPTFIKDLISNATGATLSWLGRSAIAPRGLAVLVSLRLFSYGKDIYDTLYIKSQLNAAHLPIDVFVLQYRGTSFQAGLVLGQDDLFSVKDILYGMYKDSRREIEDVMVGLVDDLAGRTVAGNAAVQTIRENANRGR